MKQFLSIISLFLISFSSQAQDLNNLLFEKTKDKDFQSFVYVLGKVESNNKDNIIGDNLMAVGRYQIWESCFLDAQEFSLKNGDCFQLRNLTHNFCFNQSVSYRVLVAYCARYELKALKDNNFESLARLWNSGPNWRKKKEKTNHYWYKIKLELHNQIKENT